jgi:hypothetical protein
LLSQILTAFNKLKIMSEITHDNCVTAIWRLLDCSEWSFAMFWIGITVANF